MQVTCDRVTRYRTAFLNPFSEIPAVDILCSFYTKDGKPLEMSPEYTMRKAHEVLKQVTGMEYEVMGELEYYVVSEKDDLFLAPIKKGITSLLLLTRGGIYVRWP